MRVYLSHMASLVVERYGYVEQGYTARVALIALTVASVVPSRRARTAYLGVGLLWSVAEIALVATSTRAGPMTLGPDWGWIVLGGIARGFSEGAAIVGAAMTRWMSTSRAAVAVLLASAALVDDGATRVSAREVVSPLGLVVTLGVSGVYLIRLAAGRARVSVVEARWSAAVAFAWNVVALVRGTRRVIPSQWTLLFALYDALFEVALLYAGLAELVLWGCAAITSRRAARRDSVPARASTSDVATAESARCCSATPHASARWPRLRRDRRPRSRSTR